MVINLEKAFGLHLKKNYMKMWRYWRFQVKKWNVHICSRYICITFKFCMMLYLSKFSKSWNIDSKSFLIEVVWKIMMLVTWSNNSAYNYTVLILSEEIDNMPFKQCMQMIYQRQLILTGLHLVTVIEIKWPTIGLQLHW